MSPAVPIMERGAVGRLLDSFGGDKAIVPHALCCL